MQIMSDDRCHSAAKSEIETLRTNKTKGLECMLCGMGQGATWKSWSEC